MRRLATAIAVAGAVVLVAAPGASGQETLDLEDAIRVALMENPAIARAEANAATAAANRWADWGALLPTATLSASLSRSDFSNITFPNPDGTTTILDEPIEDVSRNNSGSLSLGLQLGAETFTQIDAGGEERAASDLRLSAAQADVVRQVKVAYFDALLRQRLVDVARRQVEGRREDFELTQEKYRIAAVGRSDLLGAEIELRNAELALIEAEDAFDAAIRAIRVAQGIDRMDVTDIELVDPAEVPDAETLDVDGLLAAARRANPELRALAADERAASTSVFAARMSYLPTLNFSLNFSRSRGLGDDEGRFTFSPVNTNRGLNISASLPLFNGFDRKTRNAQASNNLAIARASLTEQELLLEQDVRRLVADIRRSARRLEVLERNAELARERLDLTREQYRTGSVDYFSLQQTIESIDAAERAVFEQRYELLKQWAELENRVGDGLH
ncbi:MAG TPA: TolC family protein [Gemmatimonadota bacterium]|nr:TolC family protein [Gemmatimonadota bacterium]